MSLSLVSGLPLSLSPLARLHRPAIRPESLAIGPESLAGHGLSSGDYTSSPGCLGSVAPISSRLIPGSLHCLAPGHRIEGAGKWMFSSLFQGRPMPVSFHLS